MLQDLVATSRHNLSPIDTNVAPHAIICHHITLEQHKWLPRWLGANCTAPKFTHPTLFSRTTSAYATCFCASFRPPVAGCARSCRGRYLASATVAMASRCTPASSWGSVHRDWATGPGSATPGEVRRAGATV